MINFIPLIYANKERPTMFFYSRVAPKDVGQSLIADIPNASYNVNIPGLTLIKDFITEEEVIINIIQEKCYRKKQLWNKLN